MDWIFFNKLNKLINRRHIGHRKRWPFFNNLQEYVNNWIGSDLIWFIFEILNIQGLMKMLWIVFPYFLQKLVIKASPLNTFIYPLFQLSKLYQLYYMLWYGSYTLLLMPNHNRDIFGVLLYSHNSRLYIIDLFRWVTFTKHSFFLLYWRIVLIESFDFLPGKGLD